MFINAKVKEVDEVKKDDVFLHPNFDIFSGKENELVSTGEDENNNTKNNDSKESESENLYTLMNHKKNKEKEPRKDIQIKKTKKQKKRMKNQIAEQGKSLIDDVESFEEKKDDSDSHDQSGQLPRRRDKQQRNSNKNTLENSNLSLIDEISPENIPNHSNKPLKNDRIGNLALVSEKNMLSSVHDNAMPHETIKQNNSTSTGSIVQNNNAIEKDETKKDEKLPVGLLTSSYQSPLASSLFTNKSENVDGLKKKIDNQIKDLSDTVNKLVELVKENKKTPEDRIDYKIIEVTDNDK